MSRGRKAGLSVTGSARALVRALRGRDVNWSIGIYGGQSPWSFTSPGIKDPALSAADVTDVLAGFVADPFMLHENENWYMFFEVWNIVSRRGNIGLATSRDAVHWKYEQIVLDEPFHLSYPYVFKWEGEYYMLPESRRASSVKLYKASNFPRKWLAVKDLMQGDYADPSILYYDAMWWLFVLIGMDELALYYSHSLDGPWNRHPKNPLISNNRRISRPGGRMVVYNGRIVRYAQDGVPTYGNQLRAFEIDTLTTTDYQEHEVAESPILKASGKGWNANGMHHIDPHPVSENRWIACVDGNGERRPLGDLLGSFFLYLAGRDSGLLQC